MLSKIAATVADTRHIGLGFVARHLRPWAKHHTFNYGGKPFTFRRGTSDSQVIRYLLVGGEYRLDKKPAQFVRRAYEDTVQAGKTPMILDAGGNIGMTAIWFARTYPMAMVFTLEPDPANYAILEENVRHWPNIVPIRVAIGGTRGLVNLSGSDAWAVQTERAEHGGVDVVTVGDVVDMCARGGFDPELLIVKIDIEGFESDVFDGDTSWLDDLPCMMIEPHDWLRPDEGTSHAFQREMGLRDFNLYIRDNNLLYVRSRLPDQRRLRVVGDDVITVYRHKR